MRINEIFLIEILNSGSYIYIHVNMQDIILHSLSFFYNRQNVNANLINRTILILLISRIS